MNIVIFHEISSVPHNNVMDVNNVMQHNLNMSKVVYIVDNTLWFSSPTKQWYKLHLPQKVPNSS